MHNEQVDHFHANGEPQTSQKNKDTESEDRLQNASMMQEK